MFNLFKRKPPAPEPEPPKERKPRKPRQPKPKNPTKEPSAKEIATQKGEPYINIISMELDPTNIGIGAFELDWNEFFIAKLIKSGYKGANEEQLVDQWFQDVCRNIVMETYEQFEANNPRPPNGIQKKDLGNGRVEVS
jgi:hypothetical protein